MIKQFAKLREVQGLYGPMRIPERLLQLIWARRDYAENRLQTLDGRAIRVIRTGSWNHREGPDFLDASLLIGGEPVRGDVEIHFQSRNWREHGHHLDAAFSSVILHLILFSPNPGEASAVTSSGRYPPVCSLLEAMDCGLEEYAEGEVLRMFSGLPASGLAGPFTPCSQEERCDRLRNFARERWETKVNWSVNRLKKASWEDVCHQFFLEVLGYPRNRAAMSSIALVQPLSEWRRKLPDPNELFLARQREWKLAGIRPANHPRVRLQKYAKMVATRPDWPELAREFGAGLSLGGADEATSGFRKQRNMPRKKQQLAWKVFGKAISSGSVNTWVIDGLLPLLTAETGRDLFGWWFHWFAGNAPDGIARFLKEIGVTGNRSGTLCNGWVQGGLGAVASGMVGGEQIED